MRRVILSIIVSIAVMVSCQKTFDYSNVQNEVAQKTFVLPIEKSLEILGLVCPDVLNQTRASAGNVEILSMGDFRPATRGGDACNSDDPIVYIVPLDNGGCAIMGADVRMQPVYAILESTTLTSNDILLMSEESNDSEIIGMVSGMLNSVIQSDIDKMDSRVMDSIILTPVYRYVHDTTIIARQLPLLRTKWHQGFPYNNETPGCPAGCAPVALAQIMYHHKWPHSLDGYTFNWSVMASTEFNYNNPNQTPPPMAALEVARLIHKFGENIHAIYKTEKTTAKPDNVLAFFYTSPFNVNPILQQYNVDKIYMMLNDSLPVMVFGETSPQLDTISRHAWVIDGYDFRQITTYDRITNTIVNDDVLKLVHCNYGVNGACDGFYTSGVFDLREERKGNELIPAIGDRPHTISDKDYSFNVMFIEYHND